MIRSRFTQGLYLLSIVAKLMILQSCAPARTQSVEDGRPERGSLTSEHNFARQQALAETESPQTDFSALRSGFTKTAQYQPWDTKEHEAAKAMFDAFENRDYALCFALSEALVKANYTNLDAHFGLLTCGQALGREAPFLKHEAWLLKGLMRSILNSGDGQTVSTAYRTISLNESRAFVRLRGLMLDRHDILSVPGKNIDVLHCTALRDDAGDTTALYFDNTPALLHSFGLPQHPILELTR